MLKNRCRQLISVAAVIAILFVQMFSVYCSAASKTGLAVESVNNVAANSSVNVTVTISSDNPININGFSMFITYPEEQIEYVNGSAQSKINGVEGATTYCSAGRVYFAWESDTAVTLQSGKFVVFTFNTKQNFTGAKIDLTINSMYNTSIVGGKLVFNDIDLSPAVSGNLSLATSDADVLNVIEMINNIGTVAYTPECKQKIDDAYNAYLKLSLSKRKNVTNYSELAEAIKLYDKLKQSADYDASDAEVEKFLSDHKRVLSLSLSSVTLDDLEGIENALSNFNSLSTVAQSRLLRQKYQLNSLLKKAKELASDRDEERRQEELRKEAEKLANDFRNNLYSWTLKLTPETVTVDDETGVRANLDELEGVAIMSDLAYEMLAPEKKLLDSLLEKIEKLLIEQNPADAEYIKEANRFKNNFSYILNLDPSEVTADDELYITIAYEVYSMLSDKTKSYLTNEGKILEKLLEAVSNIAADDNSSDTSESEDSEAINSIEKIVYREGSGKDYLVKLSNKKLSKTVWIMIALAITAFVNAVLIYIYSLYYKRKTNLFLNEPAEEVRF